MHPTEVEPGVTLAGRYRVAELLAEAPGDGGAVARTWRAIDEVLSRSVVIYVLSADDARAEPMLEASRRAATVSDVRFLRVLDALEEDGIAYVVREWVEGRTLAELLADGPLPPRDAGLVVREVAEALGRAHEQKLYHERLDPDSVLVTDGGTIKIVGLATQVALSAPKATPTGDPARIDAIGLGRLLYAALTARWPTGPRSGLAAGPRAADGTLLSPRQCRAGVPRALDEITERILSDRPRHGSPLGTPREIVDALTGTVGTTPPEGVLASSRTAVGSTPIVAQAVPVRPARPEPGPGYPGEDVTSTAGHAALGTRHFDPHDAGAQRPPPPARPPQRAYAPYRPQRLEGPRWSRIAIVIVTIVMLAGLGLLGWQLVRQAMSAPGGDDATAGPSPSAEQSSPAPSPSSTEPYPISAAKDFDPGPKGNNEEHPDEVALAYDGKADTAWTTMSYKGHPEMGRIKDGVGIWFDLGEARDIGEIELALHGSGPTDLEVRVAPEDATEAPSALDGWTSVAAQKDAGTAATLAPEEPVTSRFVLVWLTKLPPETGGYRGGVAEIVVRP